MRYHFRQHLAPCLLAAAVLLPLAAHAADSDGDGVDDSVDAFPAHVEATTDTDGDGLPDSIDYSKLPGYFYEGFEGSPQPGWAGISSGPYGWIYTSPGRLELMSVSLNSNYTLSRSVTVPTPGGQVSFITGDMRRAGGSSFSVDGSAVASYSCFFKSPCSASGSQTLSFPLTAGTHTLAWRASCGSGSGPYAPAKCGVLYEVVVRSNSALTEDTDDDNDGVADSSDACPLDPTGSIGNMDGDALCNLSDPDDDNDGIPDAFDPAPLDPNSKWSLDGGYKGSAIHEVVSP